MALTEAFELRLLRRPRRYAVALSPNAKGEKLVVKSPDESVLKSVVLRHPPLGAFGVPILVVHPKPHRGDNLAMTCHCSNCCSCPRRVMFRSRPPYRPVVEDA